MSAKLLIMLALISASYCAPSMHMTTSTLDPFEIYKGQVITKVLTVIGEGDDLSATIDKVINQMHLPEDISKPELSRVTLDWMDGMAMPAYMDNDEHMMHHEKMNPTDEMLETDSTEEEWAHPYPEPESEPESKPEMEHTMEHEGKPEMKHKMEHEGKPEMEHQVEHEGKPEMKHKMEHEGKPEMEHKMEHEGKPEMKHKMEHEGKPEMKHKMEHEGKPEMEHKMEHEGKPEMKHKMDHEGKPMRK